MKQKSITFVFVTIFLIATFAISAIEKPSETYAKKMPDKIKVIVEKSCYGCHNTDSKNEDAKEDLDFKTFDGLSKVKMVHALKEIVEVVEKDEMPPKKFLQRFPEKALSSEEKKTLVDWGRNEAKGLMK